MNKVLFVSFSTRYLSYGMRCTTLQAVVIGEPITVSAVYDPWNKDSLFNGDTFLMIQKEMKYHLLIAQIIPTPVITMAPTVHFATVSDQTSIVMLTLDVPQPSSY